MFMPEFFELTLELGESVPVAIHQEQHGELVSERSHAAFADASAAVGDRFGQLMHHADAIPADGANHNMLFHRRKFYRMALATVQSQQLW
jgi:tRNA A-37 threonylcarbamoyl transferase component Bud32